MRSAALTVIDNNEAFHRLLVDGVDVKFSVGDGKTRTDKVWLIDFTIPENNEFLAVNQFTVIENNNNKRPDIVIFINGLPLVVIELKNADRRKRRCQRGVPSIANLPARHPFPVYL
jgi:type I restriction enzyme, R subunit